MKNAGGSDGFDPYYKWLGIPPQEQPPTHYRLLSINVFEHDRDVIEHAADRLMAQVKQFQIGAHSGLSQQILNQIAVAKRCLLTPAAKERYDEELRARQTAAAPTPLHPVVAAPAPLPMARPLAPVPLEPRSSSAPDPEFPSVVDGEPLDPGTRKPPLVLIPLAAIAVIVASVGYATFFHNSDPKSEANQPLVVAQPVSRAKDKDESSRPPARVESGIALTDEAPTERPAAAETAPPKKLAEDVPPRTEAVPRKPEEDQPEDEQPEDEDAQQEAKADDARMPVPAGADQDKATKLIRELFKDDFTQAKGAAKQLLLSEKLRKAADDAKSDVAGRYVLLKMSRDAAEAGNDLQMALELNEELAGEFRIDELAEKVASVERASKTAKSPAECVEVVEEAMAFANAAAARDRHDLSTKATAAASRVVKRTKSFDVAKNVQAQTKRLQERRKTFDRFIRAEQKLSNSPEDAEANESVGRYRCFVKSEWVVGLPMLAKGSDPKLRMLAERDVANPAETTEQVSLGDGWWDFAEVAEELTKPRIYERANHWYRKAGNQLSGLEKIKVQKRLERDDNGPKMKLCFCPAGSFKMGSPESDGLSEPDEKPQVEVSLTRDFWLGKYEVRQGEWEQVMGTTPWKGSQFVKEGVDYPATNISWQQAQKFCQMLTASERKSGRLSESQEYRLPTEAEWEYACRAATTTRYSFGDDTTNLSDDAWWGGRFNVGNAKSEQYGHQVGLKKPNAWGLYDLHGNVWEWCSDWYGSKLAGGRDPKGPSQGSWRVDRGGGWDAQATDCRSANRNYCSPAESGEVLGFRVVRIGDAVDGAAFTGGDPERAAANWAFSRGAYVGGTVNGVYRDFKSPAELPAERFKLTHLYFDLHPVQDGSELRVLKDLNDLVYVNFRSAKIGDAGVKLLKGKKRIEYLGACVCLLTDESLLTIGRMNSLRELSIEGNDLTDAGIAQLSGLRNLERLYLNGTRVTDAGMQHLRGMTKMKRLFVNQMVTDRGLEVVRDMPDLEQLDMPQVSITDASLAYLSSLKKLRVLDLRGTKIGDNGLKHLAKIETLRELQLGRTAVTDTGVAELQKALPNCVIDRRAL